MKRNKLPKNWKLVKLGEICHFIGGGTPSKNNKLFWNGDISWASIKDIKGKYLIKTYDYISQDGLQQSATNLALPNEIILATRINPGRAIISKIQTAINQDLKVVRPKSDIDTLYLYYAFLNYERDILKLSSGTTVKGITLNLLNNIEFPLPSLEDQKKIVFKIEELFSELDKGIEDLKTAQEQLKIYRQSVLKWAFEGKLTNKNVKDQELPKGWEQKLLREIFKVSSGKGIKINQLNGGDHPVYGGNGLNGYHSDFFIEEPVLIIGRVGVKCGVTHITKPKSWVSDNALIVKPLLTDFNIQYFKLRLEFEDLNKLSVSTAQPVISGNSIYSVSIPLPKIKEQQLIVEEIEKRLSVALKMEENITQSLQQAEALRQSILKKAFSGELVK